MTVEWDFSEVEKFAADLGKVPGRVVTAATAVVLKGAVNITKDAKMLASGFRSAPLYPASIGWDWIPSLVAIEAEIGPDKDRPQGALGNLIEFGSVNNPPHMHLGPATDREIPNFVRETDRIGPQALSG